MNGLLILHFYITHQCICTSLKYSLSPFLPEPFRSIFPPFPPSSSHFSFILFSAISSPLLSPLSLVFVLAENSHFISGEKCIFSLFHSSLLLLLCVFHAGKASPSCVQQGACSVYGCPIRDPYSLMFQSPHPEGCSPCSCLSGCSFLFSV